MHDWRELELSLFYRAVNTERNLIIRDNLPHVQLEAVNILLARIDNEWKRRYDKLLASMRENS